MGSLSRMNRSDRFINEFGDDFVKKLGLDTRLKYEVVSQQLVFADGEECVRFEIAMRPVGGGADSEFVVHFTDMLFDPESRDGIVEDTACRLDIAKEEAARRLVKADLIEGGETETGYGPVDNDET